MLRSIFLLGVLAATFAPADAPLRPGDENAIKGIEAWLKAYRKGTVDVGSNADVSKTSIAKKYKALPGGVLGRLTARREIEAMLQRAVKVDDAETALVVLKVAAVGGDDLRYKPDMVPGVVRQIGEAALNKLKSDETKSMLRRIAIDGYRGGGKGQGNAMQAAALRALGRLGDPDGRVAMESGLTHSKAAVRTGAADGLAVIVPAESLPALSGAIEKEREAVPLRSEVLAVSAIFGKHLGTLDESVKAPAVTAAVGALGRTSWRVDQDIVDLLQRSRSKQVVPALIDVLQRFVDEPKKIRSGELSGLLRHRAFDALTALTGATFPMTEPDRWRQWWEENKGPFEVVERKPKAGEENKTTSGFFGIPVRGTRIVFIVDLSGSMDAPMPRAGTTTGKESGPVPSRLDVAREELWQAALRLDDNAMFNVVLFSNESRTWQKTLVPATGANKKKLRKMLDTLEPEAATNLWSGIRDALGFEKNSIATDDEHDIDEVFLLSDGAPTAGEIVNPREILRTVTEGNRFKGVRINTVFIAGQKSNMDPVVGEGQLGPAGLMQEIARLNGGVFVKK